MVRVVELEVGIHPLQLLLLLCILRHLHHFSLCIPPSMCQVLSVVPAGGRKAPENDNVFLIGLNRDINLITINSWVYNLKALQLRLHLFFKRES